MEIWDLSVGGFHEDLCVVNKTHVDLCVVNEIVESFHSIIRTTIFISDYLMG